MNKDAVLSKCRSYRYALWRTWDESKPKVLFIGLNPSTADESTDDQTVRRCIGFAKQWGYGGIVMGNLFAFRSPSPSVMMAAAEPIGPENDTWLRRLQQEAKLTVAVWGNAGSHRNRYTEVMSLFPNLTCLRITKQGQPGHILYLPSDLKPFPYKGTQ